SSRSACPRVASAPPPATAACASRAEPTLRISTMTIGTTPSTWRRSSTRSSASAPRWRTRARGGAPRGCRAVRWDPPASAVPFRRFFDPTMLLMGNYIPMLTLAHRRDCLDTIGHFDEDLTALEDWELCIRLSRRWPFVAIPRLTCNFTWREPVGEAADRRLRAFVRSTEIIYPRYPPHPAPPP